MKRHLTPIQLHCEELFEPARVLAVKLTKVNSTDPLLVLADTSFTGPRDLTVGRTHPGAQSCDNRRRRCPATGIQRPQPPSVIFFKRTLVSVLNQAPARFSRDAATACSP